MPKRQILGSFFATALLLAFLGAANGAFAFLWVFPLKADALPLWMLVCLVDVLLARSGLEMAPKARLFLWSGGLVYFCALQGVPELGMLLVAGAAGLWVASRRAKRFLLLVLLVALPLVLFGHDSSLLHPGMTERLVNFRFSIHLLSGFALFRMISWSIGAGVRKERPTFFCTMEYFLSPAFWLSPMHAAHLTFDRMQPARTPFSRSLLWVLRGFLHAWLFGHLASYAIPWLEGHYRSGLASFRWWELLLLGPALFAISYLEKSRVSYIVAGLLSMNGRSVAPDFRAPWLARSLPEYWRRFHSWVWEYYVDYIYMPLSVVLARRMPARAAGLSALFLTFSVGTTLIHWVHYPATIESAFFLGLTFGLLTLAHGFLDKLLSRSAVGIPITWISVFFLYALAYPVYGLGWGLAEVLQFIRS